MEGWFAVASFVRKGKVVMEAVRLRIVERGAGKKISTRERSLTAGKKTDFFTQGTEDQGGEGCGEKIATRRVQLHHRFRRERGERKKGNREGNRQTVG